MFFSKKPSFSEFILSICLATIFWGMLGLAFIDPSFRQPFLQMASVAITAIIAFLTGNKVGVAQATRKTPHYE